MGTRKTLKVGLTYNLRRNIPTANEDDQAEYDDVTEWIPSRAAGL